MALVLAIEAGQGKRKLQVIVPWALCYCQGRIGRQVRACRRARLVTAIGTVAEVIVHGGEGDLDCGMRNAGEGFGILIEFGNCRVTWSAH